MYFVLSKNTFAYLKFTVMFCFSSTNYFIFYYLWKCVCVCLCECGGNKCVYMCSHMCESMWMSSRIYVWVWSSEIDSVVFLDFFSIYILRWRFLFCLPCLLQGFPAPPSAFWDYRRATMNTGQLLDAIISTFMIMQQRHYDLHFLLSTLEILSFWLYV